MMRRKMLSAAVIYICALGGVVLADPPTVMIEQQATLITEIPGGVIVRAAVNCGDGGATEAVLLIGVRQDDEVSEAIMVFEATGNRQEVSVAVPGPFTAGDASASALLQCALLLEGQQLGAAIKISE